MRFVSVWLPWWPVERLRQSLRQAPSPEREAAGLDERPFALVAAGPRGQTLAAVDPRARRMGLTAGLTLADARAAVPDLVLRPATPAEDREALLRLALWSGRYGPRRQVEGRDGFWIDVTGVPHLFGGEPPLVADLARRLTAFGLTAHVAIADTRAAAFALARHGARPGAAGVAIQPVGELESALRELPVAGLDLAPDTVLLLRRLGLRRIGQLYDLPRAALARRFRENLDTARRGGSQRPGRLADALAGALLQRLDQALGRAPDPVAPLLEPPRYTVRSLHAEPLISTQGIEVAANALAERLAVALARAGQGARKLRLSLYRVDGSVAAIEVGTSAPSVDGAHLSRLLRERLSQIDAGFGVDAMALDTLHWEQSLPGQISLARGLDPGGRRSPAELIDRLASRLGSDRIVRLVPYPSHIPERSERRRRALSAEPSDVSHQTQRGAPPRPTSPRPTSPTLRAPPVPPRKPFPPRKIGPGAQAAPETAAPERRSAARDLARWSATIATAGPAPTVKPTDPGAPAGCRDGRCNREPGGWPTAERPLLILSPPEPVEVVAGIPEGPPARMVWRRVIHRITRAEGPERIEPEWWLTIGLPDAKRDDVPARAALELRPRDYYRLESAEGARFWVFRAGLYQREAELGPPAWYMHGLFG